MVDTAVVDLQHILKISPGDEPAVEAIKTEVLALIKSGQSDEEAVARLEERLRSRLTGHAPAG